MIISLPRIEYAIESENFYFTKTLTFEELQPHMDGLFQDWHLVGLNQLEQIKEFNQALLDIKSVTQTGKEVKSRKFPSDP